MPVFNQSRSRIIRLIFFVTFAVIVLQLFHLQVLSGKYRMLADENARFKKTIYPLRGIIFDKKNRPIINNTLMYDLMVTPSEVKGVDTEYLCKLLEIDTAEFRKRLVEARIKNGPYHPSIFEGLLSPQKQARLEENMWRFSNGFFLQERPVRTYPYNAAAHVLGYIGEADSGIIAKSNNFYKLGDYVGRSGLEQFYEKVLMGKRGVEYMIRDNKNRVVGRFANGEFDTAAVAGRNLHTYIDIELQQLAEKLLTNKVAAAVAIEPKTGGILAMASGPDYNPNDLSGANFKKNYARMVTDVSRPLFNRAIKGQYPGGSTYKPLGALIALDEGVITPANGYPCRGVYTGCGRPIKCTENWAGHADNLRLAIAHSCNSFFSDVLRRTLDNPDFGSTRIALMKWKEYCNAFGYGHKLGVDLASEDGGNIPDTTAYDKDYRHQWNACTPVNGGLGIGQDKMLVTPLQMANAISIVANKGYYYIPHFVKNFENETEEDSVYLRKYRTKHEVLTHISDDVYNIVIDGMQEVTEVGTAAGIPKIPGINICAKTGTAENKTVIDGKVVKLKDHSLFVCFAPREDPKIAVAVIIENGGFGATWAGPIAYLLVEKYLNDTLRTERLQEVERIANANLMPTYLTRKQEIEDSVRAYKWFEMTGDSAYIERYLFNDGPQKIIPVTKDSSKDITGSQHLQLPSLALLPDKKYFDKKKLKKIA